MARPAGRRSVRCQTGIDIRQQGTSLIDFLKTEAPEQLRRKLDVSISAPRFPPCSPRPGRQRAHDRHAARPWEHNAYQSDNQFVLEVKPVKEDPNKLTQGIGKGRFGGEKLSLNFQNIDVRSVLQVIADFTNFNIITSDSVQGNLTLRLKDVPGIRRSTSSCRPAASTCARTATSSGSRRATSLPPARSSTSKQGPDRRSRAAAHREFPDQLPQGQERCRVPEEQGSDRALQARQCRADERSNKIFVNDVPSRLEDMRRLIAEIDVEVRQVLIEAQIVEATDTFARNLGVRLGFGSKSGGRLGTTMAVCLVYRNIGGGLAGRAIRPGRSKPNRISLRMRWP
jgi:type IV pilus assembly protein PilQ